MSLDNNGLYRYNPHKILNDKLEAFTNFKKAQRTKEKLITMKKRLISKLYLQYRFLTNEKYAIKDAEAKSEIDEKVKEIEENIEKAQGLEDELFGKYDYYIELIKRIDDLNATGRVEMRLGGLTP